MLKFIRMLSVLLLIACMVFVFCMSSQNADESSGTSGRVIRLVLKLVYPNFEELSSEEVGELIASMQFVIRKGAHFSIYAVMGFLSFLSMGTYIAIPFKFRLLMSSLICLLYSISDEIHQTFIPGRSGELRDVCIDFCGSLLAITLMGFVVRFSKNRFINKYFKERSQ